MKEALIKNIKELDSSHPLRDLFLKFLNSYDGTNEVDLTNLAIVIQLTLNQMDDVEIKALGYDKLKESREEANIKIQDLKKQFKYLEKNKLPPLPMESTVNESEVNNN